VRNATGDNFTFYLLVNDSSLAAAHTRFAQQVRPHMPGDETWGVVEILLFLVGAICIVTAAAMAVA
jgi:hypothetical protein